jgi:hypothetical protein
MVNLLNNWFFNDEYFKMGVDREGVPFDDTLQPPSLAQNMRQSGFLCWHITTNPPRSNWETERLIIICRHPPFTLLPRLKCKTEGVFPLSTHHHQPLPFSNCEMKGFSVHTSPPPCSKHKTEGCFPFTKQHYPTTSTRKPPHKTDTTWNCHHTKLPPHKTATTQNCHHTKLPPQTNHPTTTHNATDHAHTHGWPLSPHMTKTKTAIWQPPPSTQYGEFFIFYSFCLKYLVRN